MIVRSLLGLDDVISMSVVDPVRDGRGWAFRDGPGYTPDPVNGFTLLREAYQATEPGYDGHVSVPVLWDQQAGRIVSNNFPDITIDLGTQFGEWATPGISLYPAALRAEIDALNERVYASVNNGVYRCGFATSQEAYNSAVAELFATLDDLDQRLATRRYLLGDSITEADVRLWVTLARFDAVYVTHFKANLRRLADYPNLWPYARDLYAHPRVRRDHQLRPHQAATTTAPIPSSTRCASCPPGPSWTGPSRTAVRPSRPDRRGRGSVRACLVTGRARTTVSSPSSTWANQSPKISRAPVMCCFLLFDRATPNSAPSSALRRPAGILFRLRYISRKVPAEPEAAAASLTPSPVCPVAIKTCPLFVHCGAGTVSLCDKPGQPFSDTCPELRRRSTTRPSWAWLPEIRARPLARGGQRGTGAVRLA